MQDQGSISPSAWGWIGGAAVSIITIIATWWSNRRKTDVDESAIILGKWKDLVDTHERRIKEMTDELVAYKRSTGEELDTLRSRVRALEKKSMQDDETIRQLRTEKDGLQRQLAQVSQSTAAQLRRTRETPVIEGEIEKLSRMGDNLRDGGSGGNEA